MTDEQVWEIAELRIAPESTAAFEAILPEATDLFRRAPGCRAMHLRATVEDPTLYLLVVNWDSVDDHMVRFRASEDFARWRQLASPFFAANPVVRHSRRVGDGFGPGAPLQT